MRSSVSVILSSPIPDSNMSHPDYEQTAHDHAAILVLVKHTGEQIKHKSVGRVLERVSRVSQTKVTDCSGVPRDISARFVRDYPVENNDWGDYQTHRRLLGLITVGKYDTQTELNELCRVHESLKVKYASTLYDSRCVLIGPPESEPSNFPTPSNFKARALRYHDGDACVQLEGQITEFISSLFWVLESKRLERSREKVDKVSLLLAPFEKKDFVGLDLESRVNRKRCIGRMTKHLGDLSLQAGLPVEALSHYSSAVDILKAVNDWLWLGSAYEGLCAASVVIMYPNSSKSYPLQRNSSLQEGRPRSSTVSTNSLPSGLVPLAQEEQDLHNVLSPEDISKRYRESIIHYSKYQNAGIIETEASFKAARVAVEQNWTLQAASFLQNVVFINLTLNEIEKAELGVRGELIGSCNEDGKRKNTKENDGDDVQRFTSLADLYTRIGFHRKASFCRRLAATRYVSAQNSQPDWGQCYQLMLQALTGHSISLDPTEFRKGGPKGWPCLQVQLLQELVVAARRTGLSALATRHATFLLQALWPHLNPSERRDLAIQLQALAAQCEGAPVPLVLQSGAVIPPVNLTHLPQIRSFALQNLPPQLRPQKIEKIKEDSGPFLFTPIHFGSLERRGKTDSSKMASTAAQMKDMCLDIISTSDVHFVVLKDMSLDMISSSDVHFVVLKDMSLDMISSSDVHFVVLKDMSLDMINFLWVEGDPCEVHLELCNPLPFELKVSNMRLVTSGVVFESLPSSLSLPPDSGPHTVTLSGVPKEVGELQIQGYSTHTLGVKSNCRLRHMPGFPHPHYTVEVIPTLPLLQVSTSLPKQLSPSDITSCISLYAGESAECSVVLNNVGTTPVDLLEVSVESGFDSSQVFQWSHDNLQAQLPLLPGASASFTLYLNSMHEFLAPASYFEHGQYRSVDSRSDPTYNSRSRLDYTSSPAFGSLMSGPSSLPLSLDRRAELTPSIRSGSSGRSHSSLASSHLPLAKFSSPSLAKLLEGHLNLSYSGGAAQRSGYCRVSSVALTLEMVPSVQITNWDVLPAETSSQFYLVLDVANLTSEELELHYTPSKFILIEGLESCRIPVPVDRCPLSKLTKLYHAGGALSTEDRMELDTVCSEHIASLVDLRWNIPASNRSGRLPLRGLSLSPDMLDLVRMSPLQWAPTPTTLSTACAAPQIKFSLLSFTQSLLHTIENSSLFLLARLVDTVSPIGQGQTAVEDVCVNSRAVKPQEELNVLAGQSLQLSVCVHNFLERALLQVMIEVQFYQDHQNGVNNYRLETRMASAGATKVIVPELKEQGGAKHECCVVFFTPGQYKVDIQCSSLVSDISHTWRFIPPIAVTVVDS
uniref:Uncharacterized protein n=1 Tax=Timema genevievae TaxID=629358 RepID=A0A7R9PHC7_TIMGE|nr:unnamed protein product [Timema genevievae]